MAGRKSTVEHLTFAKMAKIIKFMEENNCGFIIRFRGIEIGLDFNTIGNRTFISTLLHETDLRKRIYIRKGGI